MSARKDDLMVVIDGIRYRTEDAIRRGLIKVKAGDTASSEVSPEEAAADKVVADRQAEEDARIKAEAEAATEDLPAKAAPSPANKARTSTANKGK